MLNINELCLLFLTLTLLLLRFYATFHATYLHNHIVFNATFYHLITSTALVKCH